MPTIDLTDNEYAAVTAAIRRAIEDDRFPRAPRLDPLRAALARFEAATAPKADIVADRPQSARLAPASRPRRRARDRRT
jgi:hypothetical protein